MKSNFDLGARSDRWGRGPGGRGPGPYEGSVAARSTSRGSTISTNDQAVEERVRSIIANALRIAPDEVGLDTVLTDELGAESIDFVDIVFGIETEFEVEFYPGSPFDKFEQAFGIEVLSKNGVLTELGAELMRERMPEVQGSEITPGLAVAKLQSLYTTRTWVRSVQEMLDARPAECPGCGSKELAPSGRSLLKCGGCGTETSCSTQEDVLASWVERYQNRAPSN